MKLLIIGSILFILLLSCWFIGRLTFIFQFYRTTSSANEPTLKNGHLLFSSKLKKPALMRFLVYRAIVPEAGLTTFIHRICGMPGDTVEIRNGVLYVNGTDLDKNLSLKHVYKLTIQQVADLAIDPAGSYTIPPYLDTLYVPLTAAAVRTNDWPFPRHILPPGLRDNAIYSIFKKNWNPDNFGPLRVPSGKYFVLGDNRQQSMDSRYQGFIDSTKSLGCLLWK